MIKIFHSISISYLLILLNTIACSVTNPTENVVIDSFQWDESNPDQQGLDPDILERGLQIAQETSFLNSIVVIKNGYLVAERYFNGHDKNMADLIYSATKSYISVLIGIALEKNILDSLDQKMLSFFPKYVHPNMDPRKHDVTIRHLLTMKAGFDTDTNLWEQVRESHNLIESVISSPLISNPGENFCYSSYAVHILSGIITKAAGMNTLEFAKKHLFKPLGIDAIAWESDQNGFIMGGGGLYSTPRDMARFGYLLLRNGRLEENQIIPSMWIQESVRDRLGISEHWGEMENLGYGYLWWTGKLNGYSLYFASGFGGQFIINIPDLNMVIVTTTAALSENASTQYEPIIQVISKYILGAVII